MTRNAWLYTLLSGTAVIALVALTYALKSGAGDSCPCVTPVAYGTINNIGQRWSTGGSVINWSSQSLSIPFPPRFEVAFNDFCYASNTHMTLVTPIRMTNDEDVLVSIRTDTKDCKLVIFMEWPRLNRTPGQNDWSLYNEYTFTPIAFAVYKL